MTRRNRLTRQSRTAAVFIILGGYFLRLAEELTNLPSGTLAAARGRVGEHPSEIAAWKDATGDVVARLESGVIRQSRSSS